MIVIAIAIVTLAAAAGFAAARFLPTTFFVMALSLAMLVPGWFLIAPPAETEPQHLVRILFAGIAWLAWGVALMCGLVGLIARARRHPPQPVPYGAPPQTGG